METSLPSMKPKTISELDTLEPIEQRDALIYTFPGQSFPNFFITRAIRVVIDEEHEWN